MFDLLMWTMIKIALVADERVLSLEEISQQCVAMISTPYREKACRCAAPKFKEAQDSGELRRNSTVVTVKIAEVCYRELTASQ